MTAETLPDVAAVLVVAERALGRHTDRAALKRHASAAVLDLRRARPRVTAYLAELARQRLATRSLARPPPDRTGGRRRPPPTEPPPKPPRGTPWTSPSSPT